MRLTRAGRALREITGGPFPVLVGSGPGRGPVKTLAGLRLNVALVVLAHSLKFRAPVP